MRKMKDSGIEWIGLIPSDWDVTRIGYESWIRARLGWKGLKAEEYVDEGFAFLSAFNIVDDKLQWENLNFINQQRYDESPEIKLKKGDILLVKDGAGIGKCARIDSLPKGAATTNGSLAVVSTYAKLSYRYLYFYLLSPIFQNYIYRLMNGMGVPHLSQEELRKIQIPYPPLAEQQRIADFLDEKCGEIDSIRSDIQKQIDILNDYKKSVITEAVTGRLEERTGFRSTDERREKKWKDSRIPRIGKIPVEWGTSRIKYVCSVIGSGTTPSSGNVLYYEGSENWIQSGDLYKKKYITETEKTVTDYAVSTISALHKYKADFIVIAMYGASIGNVAISKIDACVNQACCVIKPNSKVNFNYLYYTLINDKDIMLDMSIGGTQPNISQAKILELPVLLPPLSEQKAIADYLDEKCSEIDATIADKQRQLETLDEYKKSLIFEYVTGKKEVS